MRCPHCAAELPEGSPVCARCGRFVETVSRVVHCEFNGTGLQVAGWMLALAAGAVLIVPLAWVIAALLLWFCRRVELSDGTRVEFTGRGGPIFVWLVLYTLAMAVTQSLFTGSVRIGLSIRNGFSWPGSWLDLMQLLALMTIQAAFAVPAIRWLVRHVHLSSGQTLDFTGEYHGLLGWCLLYQLAFLTIVGWAWVLAAIGRWVARHVKGENVAFEFHGEGHQIPWRTLAGIVMSLPLVTIPWVWLWYKRWLVRNVTMIRGIHAENWAAA